MKVNFYATLRQIVGAKTAEFDAPADVTVRQLVDAIIARYPPMRKELLDENGLLYGHVHVFINGRDAPFLIDGLDTIIQPGDVANVFPAVGGG